MKACSPPKGSRERFPTSKRTMKRYQKIMATSIVPLYIIDYLVTIYFVNLKGFGIEAEGNKIIVFFWNHIGQLATFFLFLILLTIAIIFMIRNWKHLSNTMKTITTIALIFGVLIRVFAIAGWLTIYWWW